MDHHGAPHWNWNLVKITSDFIFECCKMFLRKLCLQGAKIKLISKPLRRLHSGKGTVIHTIRTNG